MSDKASMFIDTNVLIYLIGNDQRKKEIAVRLCIENAIISFNVLNEYVNVCRKKFKRPIDSINIDIDQLLRVLTLVFPGFETFEHALEIGKSIGYSHFDSLILATALETGCTVFYSEDLGNGQIIENKLKIINPFLE